VTRAAHGFGLWVFLQMSQHPEIESCFAAYCLDLAINGRNVATVGLRLQRNLWVVSTIK
jgi:hypothetical protein